MANAKEQFGLSEKPTITGIVERENESHPADAYSAQLEAELNKPAPARKKAVNKSVDAYKLTVRGNTRKGETMQAYSVEFVMPMCDEETIQYHAQRFVVAELAKKGELYDGVITRSIDEIEETTVELTFIGKDIFTLTKDEIMLACDYYGVRGCSYTNPSLRALQREFYKNYKLKTDSSLQDQFTAREFITAVGKVLDYKKLPKVVLEA